MSPSGAKNLPSLTNPVLEIVRGADQGSVYNLINQQLIKLGRSEDNDIVLATDGVSRHHATLEKRGDTWWISDKGSKNGVIVNGEKVEKAILKPGDSIQIGTSLLVFKQEVDEAVSSETLPAESQPQEFMETAPAPEKKKPNRRIIIYSVVGLTLAALWYFTQQDTSDDSKKSDKDAPKLARDFKEAEAPDVNNKPPKQLTGIEDPVLKSAEQQVGKLDWTNENVKKAEEYFRRGQKEYLAGNYHRAIDDFQAALSINRSHKMAETYWRLAVSDAEQEAKKNMEMGVQYFETLQYQRAIYHFTEVITLMSHRPNEAIVHEAEKYIEVCKKRLEAAELFP